MDVSVIVFVALIVLIAGIGTLLWSTAGVARELVRRIGRRPAPGSPLHPGDVAILIAAHNEELVIAKTLASAARHVARSQIFVASDGSTDDTVAIARRFGANVLDVNPNLGKAGAIVRAVQHFELAEHFEVVCLLDADTVLSDDYLRSGLALFSDEDTVAVAGRASSILDPLPSTLIGKILVTYRQRVYIAVQYLMKYGQAARSINVVTIVPGFASMYRTRILDRVEIAAPGLAIEDYNMTFEIHAKSLGRIAFDPHAAIAYTQDPDTLRDYSKQVARWSLGFWQTVRRHRWQPRRFWVALWLHIGELVTASGMLALTVPAIVASAVATVLATTGDVTATVVAQTVPVHVLVLGVLVPDYVLTVAAAIACRKPVMLLFGLVYPILRVADALICLRVIPRSFRRTGHGLWKSPTRRVDVTAQ